MMSKVGVSEPSDFGGSGSGYPRFWGLRLREGGFILSTGSSIIHIASIHNKVNIFSLKNCIYFVKRHTVYNRVAGAGRSRGFWLEPEPEPKFSPGSGSYSYSTVLKIFCFYWT